MVRHCVLFRFTEATTAADVDRISAAAAELPKAIPAIRSYTFGPDLRLAEGSWDFGIVGDFDDADAWTAYDTHPDHLHFRHEVIGPHVADRCAVRFAI
jgi:hypothetical protein